MNDEVVKTSKDDGFKNQWATGLFYRKDGKKKTIKSKPLLGFLAGLFAFCMVGVLFSDTNLESESRSKPIPVDGTVTAGPTHEFSRYEFKKQNEEVPKSPRKSVNTVVERLVGLERRDRNPEIRIPPGTMVKAQLASGASNGPVRARLSESVVVNGETAIPNGALLVGTGSSTEERLFIRLNQAVLSDGKVQKIDAQACDASDQTVGLKGSKVGNEALKLASGIGLNFAAGVSEGLQESKVEDGVEVKKPTTKNALLNGASTASLEYARQTMSELKSRQPIIEVPNGTEICVLFQGGDDG